jgi:hypothetical protein
MVSPFIRRLTLPGKRLFGQASVVAQQMFLCSVKAPVLSLSTIFDGKSRKNGHGM